MVSTKKRANKAAQTMKGNGNGKISYKARSTCEKLGKFFCEAKKEETEITPE